jgi:transcription elongation factor SPT6
VWYWKHSNSFNPQEDEGNPASAVEDILRQPEKLEELNLDAFAEELERQGFGNKQITLYDIRDELNQPYGEKRTEFVGPSDIDIFDMTNKETPDTFYVGK